MTQTPKAMNDHGKRLCSKCGRTNIGKQTHCLACNTALGNHTPQPQTTTPLPKFCTACGTALQTDNRFCTNCGKEI